MTQIKDKKTILTKAQSHREKIKDPRSADEKYRELVENANSIIMRMDIHGTVTFFNEYAEHFFGYLKEEILGKNVVGTIVPETSKAGRELTSMILDIAKRPEKYVNNENENMKRSGERVWISWTNKTIEDKEGNVVELLCIGNDITRRKKAEEALDKIREELEVRIQMRTSELAKTNVNLQLEIEKHQRTVSELKNAHTGLQKMEKELKEAVKQLGGKIPKKDKVLSPIVEEIKSVIQQMECLIEESTKGEDA